MNARPNKLMKLLMASVMAAPIALFAAEAAQNMPNQIMERMQVRMRAMQQINDPQARMSMMMAQMQDMQDMQGMMMGMKSGCPMAEGSQGMSGPGMMGGGSGGMMEGHMHGHMGSGTAEIVPGNPAK